MKKKTLLGLLFSLVAVLFLVACGGKAEKTVTSTSSSSTTESSSKEEAVSGASQREYTDPSELKDSYDVVVVGSGGAGMSAAISAKDAGA
ncbi:FAD-binding protein, partial [Streptococcus suis]